MKLTKEYEIKKMLAYIYYVILNSIYSKGFDFYDKITIENEMSFFLILYRSTTTL